VKGHRVAPGWGAACGLPEAQGGRHAPFVRRGSSWHDHGGAGRDRRPAEAAFDTGFSHRSQICTIRPDRTGLRQLTQVAKGYTVSSPEFSPDGIRILFTIDGRIWVMNAADSAQRQVTRQAGCMNNNPSRARDGRKIVLLTNLNQLVLSIRGTEPTGVPHKTACLCG
jgi:Tol biopolymer transport system component